MKKLYPLFTIILIFIACNTNTTNNKKTPTYHQVNVENVNGNIPDTTNAIDLSTKKTDTATSKKDTSVRH